MEAKTCIFKMHKAKFVKEVCKVLMWELPHISVFSKLQMCKFMDVIVISWQENILRYVKKTMELNQRMQMVWKIVMSQNWRYFCTIQENVHGSCGWETLAATLKDMEIGERWAFQVSFFIGNRCFERTWLRRVLRMRSLRWFCASLIFLLWIEMMWRRVSNDQILGSGG